MITLERFSGAALEERLGEIARLRIRVFRDFPYLYDGDPDYERRYLATYARAAGSTVVLALDGDTVVGASTALPMVHETDEVKAPFIGAGHAIERIFYFGESVLLPEYRGRGVGVGFFEQREAHARATGDFELACFCAVRRPDDHPARPPEHRPLDAFWRKRGYEPRPELVTEFSWKEIGEAQESPKPMSFWLKSLA